MFFVCQDSALTKLLSTVFTAITDFRVFASAKIESKYRNLNDN